MFDLLFARKTKKANPFGWLPDVPDFRDHVLHMPLHLMKSAELTPIVDLRRHMPPVYDQGDLGSCTAQTMAAAVEYDRLKRGRRSATPSTLFMYYNSRALEGTINDDAGATLRTAVKVVNHFGAAAEVYWPYRPHKFKRRPTGRAYSSGLVNQALHYQRVDQSEGALRGALATGLPVAFGFAVYGSLMTPQVARTGVVPFPQTSEPMLGGHAVLMVGYDNPARRFLCRNSWGPDWGFGGYFWLPYDYVLNPDLAADFWTLERLER